ncbi:MAG: HAMP domain-containing histidine kinase [Gammaproteobacteria bacterium]|nr:MAG: HAMP domain-containing histidine kinase [Gammaproteobacteria bacterium]
MNTGRLKILLSLLFVALAVPTGVLVFQAYGQLKWEALHQHQQLAREFALRIDRRFSELVQREENRSFTDYAFLNVIGSDGSNFLQRSPLSGFPLDSLVPGILGYFQVDARGQLATPTVPQSNASSYGIGVHELDQRVALESQIRDILSKNRLVNKVDESPGLAVSAKEYTGLNRYLESIEESEIMVEEVMASRMPAAVPAESAESQLQGQLVFDQLKSRKITNAVELNSPAGIGRLADLKLEKRDELASSQLADKQHEAKKRKRGKQARKETSVLPETLFQSAPRGDLDSAGPADEVLDAPGLVQKQQAIRIRTFETEVDPMEFSLLDSGHFVLFRRVWRDGERYVQGLLIEPQLLLDELIAPAYRESVLSSMSDLIIAYQGNVVTAYGADYAREYLPKSQNTENELLYQTRLITPFSDLELIFKLSRLPVGAGSKVIGWAAMILALVLVGGFILLYRLGAGAIALGRQQQNFVSAVSHELKTPLTSIRMYGEMLREGWVEETRKKEYYDFIFNESERLSRLINNVLHLSRMDRHQQKPNLEDANLETLLNELRPKLESQLENSGFSLEMKFGEGTQTLKLSIDSDWLTQIMINLVDNAVKFSANSKQKSVQVTTRLLSDKSVQISVRDFGPGVARDQMKKIFKLFYRSENELTRETVGTGIGLALVHQLVTGMGGTVDVVNCEPGVEFRLRFPVVG